MVLAPGGSHGDGHREQGWAQGSQGWRWVWTDTGIAKEVGARPAGRRDSSMHLGLQDTKGVTQEEIKGVSVQAAPAQTGFSRSVGSTA